MKEKDNRAQFSMPFSLENQNEQGTIKLHEGVVASVVKSAACSVDGILRLTGNSLTDSLAGFLGTRKKSDGAIKIELFDNAVAVDINVIVEYGQSIPALALKLQETIINDVKKITGMAVSQVNVNIRGVEEVFVEEEETEESVSQ